MNGTAWVEFEVGMAAMATPLRVRISELEERSVAAVDCGSTRSSGVGRTAREALRAALAPLGERMAVAVMSAPAMFGASAQLLAAREMR